MSRNCNSCGRIASLCFSRAYPSPMDGSASGLTQNSRGILQMNILFFVLARLRLYWVREATGLSKTVKCALEAQCEFELK